MPNITSQNPIRYNIDTISQTITGAVIPNSSCNIDLTHADKVNAVNVTRSQPAGTAIHLAFRVDGKWGALSDIGEFVPFSVNSADYDNVANFGNTPQDCDDLSDAPGLAGHTVGVAFALSAQDPNNALPSCSVSFDYSSATQKLSYSETSSVFNLNPDSLILSAASSQTSSQGGNVNTFIRLQNSSGTWGSWTALDSVKGSHASAIQFRADYSATTLGTSSAKLNSATVVYSDGGVIPAGLGEAEIISNTNDWYLPLKACRLTLRHAPLVNTAIECYVAFRPRPSLVTGEHLGIGAGERKTFQLANTTGIKYDTFRLYFDGQREYTGFELNCEAGRVTCNPPEGSVVSCDYEYGWGQETWQKMDLAQRYSLIDYDVSEFKASQNYDNYSVCALKIAVKTSSGTISREYLGKGSGKAKTFKLSHKCKDGVISIATDSGALSKKSFSLLEDPQYISVAAPNSQNVYASYNWISENAYIYQFAATFSE